MRKKDTLEKIAGLNLGGLLANKKVVGGAIGAGVGAVGGAMASKRDPMTGQKTNVGRNMLMGAAGGAAGGAALGGNYSSISNWLNSKMKKAPTMLALPPHVKGLLPAHNG